MWIRADGALFPSKTPHPYNNKLCFDHYHQFMIIFIYYHYPKRLKIYSYKVPWILY